MSKSDSNTLLYEKTCKCYNRISSGLEENIYLVDDESELIIEEIIDNEEVKVKMEVNILDYLDKDFENYKIFKYSSCKKEESLFKNFKGSKAYKNKKADVTFIVYDIEEDSLLFFLGELKYTLDSTTFHEARNQIISSYIDLHMINAMLSFAREPKNIKVYMYYVNKKISDYKSDINSTLASSYFYSKRVDDKEYSEEKQYMNRLTDYEWSKKKIYYKLDYCEFGKIYKEKAYEKLENYLVIIPREIVGNSI